MTGKSYTEGRLDFPSGWCMLPDYAACAGQKLENLNGLQYKDRAAASRLKIVERQLCLNLFCI